MGKFVILLRIAGAVAGWYFARKKGYNGLLWAVLCGLIPPLALVAMVLPQKRPSQAAHLCPFCRRPVPPGVSTCGSCGRALPIELVRCSNCGAYVPEQDACSQCGTKLK